MQVKPLYARQNGCEIEEGWAVCSDDGAEQYSSACANTMMSRYGRQYLPALCIGGVATRPEYRRMGCVRRLLDHVFALAPERGWAVSLLHPFSFSYYRKFGYERIADHKIVTFPMRALDFVPRCAALCPVQDERRLRDALTVFARFAETRNILFQRFDGRHYALQPSETNRATYLWYDGQGQPAAYVTVGVEKVLVVNHMESVNLHVYELVYSSPASLLAALGFLRMYEGELDSVKIHNCAMMPELDFVLRHYTHTGYTLVPDIMGRILDVPAVLEANRYPEREGRFVLRVEDTLPYTRGVYEVEYGGGEARVRRLAEHADCDLSAPMPALTQLLYGFETYTPENAAYLPGVTMPGDASDFFRAFPKRENGLFEHF